MLSHEIKECRMTLQMKEQTVQMMEQEASAVRLAHEELDSECRRIGQLGQEQLEQQDEEIRRLEAEIQGLITRMQAG